MAKRGFLAIDLGASSGRHVVGLFDGKQAVLEEVHRFENHPVRLAGKLYWDLPMLWQQVQAGLRAASAAHGPSIASVGVDTWGVDFALLGPGDELLANPVCYRDSRTDGAVERACAIVPRQEIFRQTGLQFMQINTLYQLLAMKWQKSPLLEIAESMLLMPDLFHWLLSGVQGNEITNASTTQCFNPSEGTWATLLLDHFALPRKLFGRLISAGETLGPLLPDVARDAGLQDVQVVAPATHDTASAVLAVPAESAALGKPDWCYISSGTWSLMGVEVDRPIINERCQELNFTNEGGVAGTTRLLKNICGLWLVQECRRIWEKAGQRRSWDDLAQSAAAARPLVSLINPDDPSFLAPDDMPSAIRNYCQRTGQTIPVDEGEIIRCALESIAMQSRRVLGWLEELVGNRLETIHIVGGGSQNRLLCQMTADACGRRVVAGPVEATALGNVLMQAFAAKEVANIADCRAIVRQSIPLVEFLPRDAARWEEAYQRFLAVAG